MVCTGQMEIENIKRVGLVWNVSRLLQHHTAPPPKNKNSIGSCEATVLDQDHSLRD